MYSTLYYFYSIYIILCVSVLAQRRLGVSSVCCLCTLFIAFLCVSDWVRPRRRCRRPPPKIRGWFNGTTTTTSGVHPATPHFNTHSQRNFNLCARVFVCGCVCVCVPLLLVCTQFAVNLIVAWRHLVNTNANHKPTISTRTDRHRRCVVFEHCFSVQGCMCV